MACKSRANFRSQFYILILDRFLWASLQIQNLCDPERMIVASDVEDALARLPPTLFQLYKAIMERIDRIASHGRTLAKKALRWLLCAREPLTSETLVEMLGSRGPDDPQALQILKDEILSLCCNLVVLDNAFDVFRFAHASVRDFLEDQPDFAFSEINTQAAAEALTFVQSEWKDDTKGFANYAVKHWIFHYRDLDFQFRRNHPLSSSVRAFFVRGTVCDPFYKRWELGFTRDTIEDTMGVTSATIAASQCYGPLYLACAHGLLEVVDALANNLDVDLNDRNYIGETGLYIAARQRYPEIVERLLDLGADQGIPTFSNATALHRAAENGDQVTLLLLLQHGADIIVRDDQGFSALDWQLEASMRP